MRKVKHGTPLSDENLCNSCRHAQIVQGLADSQEVTFCSEVYWKNNVVPFPIHACNSYDNAAQPPLAMMKQIAWEVRTDASGQKIGFVSPANMTRDEREKLAPLVNPRTGDILSIIKLQR